MKAGNLLNDRPYMRILGGSNECPGSERISDIRQAVGGAAAPHQEVCARPACRKALESRAHRYRPPAPASRATSAPRPLILEVEGGSPRKMRFLSPSAGRSTKRQEKKASANVTGAAYTKIFQGVIAAPIAATTAC